MPVYDRRCINCDNTLIDVFEPVTPPEVPCPQCSQPTERVWLQRAATIVSDEIDFTTSHIDGKERRFTSREELKRFMKEKGVEYRDRHVPYGRDTDKSPFTSRWY